LQRWPRRWAARRAQNALLARSLVVGLALTRQRAVSALLQKKKTKKGTDKHNVEPSGDSRTEQDKTTGTPSPRRVPHRRHHLPETRQPSAASSICGHKKTGRKNIAGGVRQVGTTAHNHAREPTAPGGFAPRALLLLFLLLALLFKLALALGVCAIRIVDDLNELGHFLGML
jgi:hypothetical protein